MRDPSEITGRATELFMRDPSGPLSYLCREGHNFFGTKFWVVIISFYQNYGRVIKCNFLSQKPADFNICPSNYPPTNWSVRVSSNRSLVQGIYLIQYISFLKLYVFQSICNCLENRRYLIVFGMQ